MQIINFISVTSHIGSSCPRQAMGLDGSWKEFPIPRGNPKMMVTNFDRITNAPNIYNQRNFGPSRENLFKFSGDRQNSKENVMLGNNLRWNERYLNKSGNFSVTLNYARKTWSKSWCTYHRRWISTCHSLNCIVNLYVIQTLPL